MYGYKDYYDEALRKKPYTDSREAMEEYRALIELMLEDMAGVKGIGTEDGLFSKGMVISERDAGVLCQSPGIKEQGFLLLHSRE